MKKSAKAIPPRESFLLAIGIGALCAWWNVCHEDGMLFLIAQVDRMASCVGSTLGGMIVFVIAAVKAKGGLRVTFRTAVVVALLMLATQIALDVFVPMGNVAVTSALQIAASTLFVGCLVAALSSFEDVSQKRLLRLAAITLASYCVFEALAFLSYETTGALVARNALHLAALIAGVALLGYVLLPGKRALSIAPLKAGSFSAASSKRGLPWQYPVHVLAYSVIFGITHALSSGVVPADIDKIAPCYIGTGVAALLIFVMHRLHGTADAFWPLLRQYIFPVAILSFALLPLANWGATMLSVAMAECAMDAYFAFLIIATAIAAKKIDVSWPLAMALSLALSSIGMVAGVGLGNVLRIADCLTPPAYSVLTVFALILVCAGTFWVGNDKQVFYVWGLEKRLTPRRFAEQLLEEKCALVAKSYGLTRREQEILLELMQRMTPQQIAEQNFIAVNTVRTHISRVHRKLQAHSRREVEELTEQLWKERDA